MPIQTNDLSLEQKIRGEIIQLAGESSALAKLGNVTPVDLSTNAVLSIVSTSGVQVVGEGQAKVETPVTFGTQRKQRSMIQAQARLSQQALDTSADNGVSILKATQDALAADFGRNSDIMMLHGTNPINGAATEAFTSAIAAGANTITVPTAGRADDALREAIVALREAGKNINGILVTPAFYSKLAYTKDNDGRLLYPWLTMSAPGEPVAFDRYNVLESTAVSNKAHTKGAVESNIEFVVGDFSKLSFGLDPVKMRIFDQGDPDSTGKDLAGHNQVMVRIETWLEYVILDKAAFVAGTKA